MWYKPSKKEVQYIPVPQNYPMGAYTFLVACAHCKNKNSNSVKCSRCLCEIESGFELDANTFDAVPVETLEAWLYEIAINNTDNDLCDSCEELISRLDGLRAFAKDRKEKKE